MEYGFNENKLRDIFDKFFGNKNNIRSGGSFKSFLKGIMGVYLILAIILFVEGKLIFDFTLSASLILIPFIAISFVYGIIHSMKGLRNAGIIVLLLLISVNFI